MVFVQALVEEGKIKYIGLSEVGPDDLRKAHKVHPISAVQLEWSLWTRDAEVGESHIIITNGDCNYCHIIITGLPATARYLLGVA